MRYFQCSWTDSKADACSSSVITHLFQSPLPAEDLKLPYDSFLRGEPGLIINLELAFVGFELAVQGWFLCVSGEIRSPSKFEVAKKILTGRRQCWRMQFD